jgi:hypothetical protein
VPAVVLPAGAKPQIGHCGRDVFVGHAGLLDFIRIPLHLVAKVQQ